jgi:hypothetical protein
MSGNHGAGDGVHHIGDHERRLAIRVQSGRHPAPPTQGSSETDFDSSKYLLEIERLLLSILLAVPVAASPADSLFVASLPNHTPKQR